MTDFSERACATALRQIEKYGKTVTLKRAPSAEYDPETQENVEGDAPDDEVFKALVKDFDGADAKLGLLLQTGDKKFLIAAQDRDKPSIGDKIVSEGDGTFFIVPTKEGGLGVQTVYAGERAALYRVHGRQS